jgi:alpha-beta hydrolase superfamily lysophospholipase
MRTKSLAAAVAILMMTALAACAPPNPYQRGPEPTEATFTSPTGPYAFASQTVSNASTPGFGAATIYYPTTTADGTFGGVAISPGFTENQSAVSWFGPRLASHGFVVITFDTNDPLESPEARTAELLAALDYLTNTSSVRDRVDRSRLAVMGHSMGGGGALGASKERPALQASIPLTPWHTDGDWPEVQVPTMVIAAENDQIAGSDVMAKRFYNTMPTNVPKAFLEMAGADHFITNSPNNTVARGVISWLKRFVDDDTRYQPFLCPNPTGAVYSEYYSTCPYA